MNIVGKTMTKSTITRERLEEIRDYDTCVNLEESAELARMVLAAMDSEPVAPVAEIVSIYGDPEAFGEREIRPLVGIQQMPYGTKLYRHAQPAPVVPVVPNGLRLSLSNAGIAAPESDEMLAATCEKHIQALVTWVKDRKPFQSAPVVPSFEEWLSAANRKPLGWVKDAMREAYDACRAAMLQAQSDDDGEPTDDERIMAIEGIHNCERCGDEGWIVGEMGITRCACGQAGNSPVIPDCWCRTCRPVVLNDMRFVVCPDCGNKRCPRANDHRNSCTGSNEHGQEGSAYPDAPREVK